MIIATVTIVTTSPLNDDDTGGDIVDSDTYDESFSFHDIISAMRELKPSDSSMSMYTWFEEATPDINFATGEETSKSLHYNHKANKARAWKYWIKAARHVFHDKFVGDLT